MAWHSPVNYPHWGFVSMHYDLLQIPALQEIIAEVWTGTARTPVLSAGVRAERTFEVGYIEYSSCYHLARGTGKRMWFLMDPMEDNLNRPMEDYQRNYAQTLLAALMFPRVDSYEVLVWPNRIFGHVPEEYATLINTVVGALCEMWRYEPGQAGSKAWAPLSPVHRLATRRTNQPVITTASSPSVCPSCFAACRCRCSLDRAAEPGYLDGFKTLLVSARFPETMARP